MGWGITRAGDAGVFSDIRGGDLYEEGKDRYRVRVG